MEVVYVLRKDYVFEGEKCVELYMYSNMSIMDVINKVGDLVV